MNQARLVEHRIEPWRPDHDATAFSSGMESIDRYIKQQAHRDMSSHASLIFVLTKPGETIIRGYYSLSSLGIVFDDLPKNVRKRISRYPQIGATLLGKLGVDKAYKAALQTNFGQSPRLGEALLTDAQIKALKGATSIAGSALMVIDVDQPTAEELTAGARDPISFYTQYGFTAFPGNDRRVLKTMRAIEAEYGLA